MTKLTKHTGYSKDKYGCEFNYTAYRTIEREWDFEKGRFVTVAVIESLYICDWGGSGAPEIRATTLEELKTIINEM